MNIVEGHTASSPALNLAVIKTQICSNSSAASMAAVTKRAPFHQGKNRANYQDHDWNPVNWALWKRPKRVIVFLFIMEAIAFIGFFLIFKASRVPTGLDWLRFGILAVGTTIHIQLTQRQEERRRAGAKTVLIDLTAVWSFPAALILPAPLGVLLIIFIRTQRWFTARRPAHIFIFSTIAQALAIALTHVVYVELGSHDWQSLTLVDTLVEFGMVIVAAAVHEAVQIIYVSGILALGVSKSRNIRSILGSKADNLLEVVTTALGAITAVLLVIMPPAVAIMAMVTVIFNRLAELDQLQDDARTDPKTQVFNMRGWSEFADRALARATKAQGTVALLMIDLDHFKTINDSYGHPAGDDVLRTVAQKINEITRPGDIVGRFGGEEFLVLLPQTNLDTAGKAAERIRLAISHLRIPTTDKRGDRVIIVDRTTSIGVAAFPYHGEKIADIMQAADGAVYDAKENGRNQVRVARQPVADSVPTDPAPSDSTPADSGAAAPPRSPNPDLQNG